MKSIKTIFFFLIVLTVLLANNCPLSSQTQISNISPHEIIAKLNQNFSKIKDATADITLEYNLHFFGCSGKRQLRGKGYFKYPNKIKSNLEDIIYFAQGNRIRKIDGNGKRWHVKLIDAIDFSVGFNPKLIPHNFYLKVAENNAEQFVLEGTPKPGRISNVKKVFFHIDKKEYLLRELNVKFVNERLGGRIKIDYEKMGNIWVPASFAGESAVLFRKSFLIGMEIKLKGENVKINNGLPDVLFNPGF